MTYKPRAAMPAGGFTLAARYYTDADVFATELERFFRAMWVYAGRTEDLPEPGDYRLIELAGDSLVLVRRQVGLGAFYNVCRHRGTRLCVEPAGRLAGRIQCPYHAWTYDLDGRLVGAPHMDEVPHFRKEDYPLACVQVDTWDGHVFVNLADHPAPLADQLGSLRDRFVRWNMAALRRGGRLTYDVRANWKLLVQNYSECLHCPMIHPVLNRLSHYLGGENEPLAPGYMGGRMDLEDGVASMTPDGSTARACLPGLDPADTRRVYYYAVFPNLLLTLHPDYMMTHTLEPKAVDRTEVVCDFHFHPDELARPAFDASDALAFWDMTNRQDWHVCELAQQGIGSRGYRPGPYSNREDLLHAFDEYITDQEIGDGGVRRQEENTGEQEGEAAPTARSDSSMSR
jgi:Rieske 2Fe-2S family protein